MRYLLVDNQAKNTITLEKIDITRNEDERMQKVLSFIFWDKFSNIEFMVIEEPRRKVKIIELIMNDKSGINLIKFSIKILYK